MNPKHGMLAALLAAASFGTAAHGDEAHAKKEDGPARREQKEWGVAGDPKAARRTIEIAMSDNMRFSPDRLQVREGETVRLVVRNTGRVLHELVLGTRKELEEHAALMAKFPGMEHDEPYMTHVAPGKVGEIVWNFNRPGDFDFACLVPGHYKAGMVGTIKVVPGQAK
jgi:uncharacterized cupredoxin-like copper-binding protein